ncbi:MULTISPECIES: hypothetical protein [unclassified Streptomyces]|uniref:hypothetical protein n=1 Tax=unclassified Streptomyces TaxID=2593676 RepID=UPI00136E3B9A|nr:hypothetical protein [Streptomyces sp. YIM 132580]MXG28439.1 hypothetical protein [Streptomyces sp. YIM 132580]
MVAPTLPHLSPAQRERLEHFADVARLRTALHSARKLLPARRRFRTRRYPAGGPNRWRSGRGRRRG